MTDVEEKVESYLNGNIGEVKAWLKKTSKVKVLEFAEALGKQGHAGTYETIRLVR